MSNRSPLPRPRPYRPEPVRAAPHVTLAVLANIVGLVLLIAAVAGVTVAAWRFDGRLGLAVLSAGVGFLGWKLTTVTDGEA